MATPAIDFIPMRRFLYITGILSLLLVLAPPIAQGQIFQLPHADTTSGTFFGTAVALEDSRAVVGASSENSCGEQAGAAYVFERKEDSNQWERVARLIPSDCEEELFFGREVAISGDRILVSASRGFFATHRPSAVYVFERAEDGSWGETARLTADADQEEGSFGASINLDGNRALITTWGDASGGEFHGAAYVYDYNEETQAWTRTARLSPNADTRHGIFGGPAALDGDRIAVSASTYFGGRKGSVYIYEYDRDENAWEATARIRDIDDFYISLALDGPRLLVGESRAGRQKEGLVRVIKRGAHGQWHRNATIRSPRPYREGGFGTDIALHGSWLLVTGFDEQFGLNKNIDRVVFAYRHDRSSLEWTFEHVIDIGAVDFGAAVDLYGPTALVGRTSEDRAGAAYVIHIPHLSPSAAATD